MQNGEMLWLVQPRFRNEKSAVPHHKPCPTRRCGSTSTSVAPVLLSKLTSPVACAVGKAMLDADETEPKTSIFCSIRFPLDSVFAAIKARFCGAELTLRADGIQPLFSQSCFWAAFLRKLAQNLISDGNTCRKWLLLNWSHVVCSWGA